MFHVIFLLYIHLIYYLNNYNLLVINLLNQYLYVSHSLNNHKILLQKKHRHYLLYDKLLIRIDIILILQRYELYPD